MLANNLTLDDEEAVQEDLRQLEAEAVRLVPIRPFFIINLSVQLGTIAEVPLQLPHIPTTVPASEMRTGASNISFTLYHHLIQNSKYSNRSPKQHLWQSSRHNSLTLSTILLNTLDATHFKRVSTGLIILLHKLERPPLITSSQNLQIPVFVSSLVLPKLDLSLLKYCLEQLVVFLNCQCCCH